jgi:predicted RNA-binding Zn-ribbon protein involved in translation (DUF1610 family)
MILTCSTCGWSGTPDERVPASAAWIAEHDVDADHFRSNNLNCPDCGDSNAWQVEYDEDDGFSDEDYS